MSEDKMTIEQVDLRRYPQEEVKAEEVRLRRDHLLDLGFSEEWVGFLAKSRPTLYAPSIVDAKLAGFDERGFSNPIKMIKSLPSILGLTFENINAKIEGLTERKFTNPIKMIESSPVILGLTFENIDRRLKLISKLIKLYGLQFSAPALMELDSFLFSSKIDKILVLVRVLRHYKVDPLELNESIMRRLLGSNLEDTLVALNQSSNQDEAITDFLRRVNSVKRLKLPKEKKRHIIKEGLIEFEKIRSRYFRGYPEA